MAKKVITSMDRGDKYDPTKYAPVGPIQAKDMGPYISKAKAAIKKDCMEEKKKKSKTSGQVSS